jgi:predicted GNAT superfamily acetyltransferase
MSACISLQQHVWNYAEIEVVPEHIFVVATIAGGQVLGAFHNETAVGFSLAFPAVRGKHLHLHSHMVAVLPEYEHRGIGRKIKMAQRDDALNRGFDLIEWTFDPLQIRNAHFNISRLGAIVRHYLPDLYGRTSSPLHGNLPTDRLVAEWWIASQRVEAVLANRLNRPVESERISLPWNIREICRTEPQRALAIQQELRQCFEQSLARGYAAVGFDVSPDHASYLMGPYEN